MLSPASPTAEPAAEPAAELAGNSPFPFIILVGTSAGALNATYLTSRASEGLHAFTYLANFWGELGSLDVYHHKERQTGTVVEKTR